jgi:hypothetical protein
VDDKSPVENRLSNDAQIVTNSKLAQFSEPHDEDLLLQPPAWLALSKLPLLSAPIAPLLLHDFSRNSVNETEEDLDEKLGGAVEANVAARSSTGSAILLALHCISLDDKQGAIESTLVANQGNRWLTHTAAKIWIQNCYP